MYHLTLEKSFYIAYDCIVTYKIVIFIDDLLVTFKHIAFLIMNTLMVFETRLVFILNYLLLNLVLVKDARQVSSMRLCRLQFTSPTGHMLHVFGHSISRGSSYGSELHKHVAEPFSMLLTFLPVWPAVNVNRAVGFGMQTFAHMQLEWNHQVNPLWTITRFQNRLIYPQFKQFKHIQKWEASKSLPQAWKSRTQYIYTLPFLKRKSHSRQNSLQVSVYT